jgi:hypothetical protein
VSEPPNRLVKVSLGWMDVGRAWAALEGFQYDLADLDPAADLAIAEMDLQHYLGLHDATELPTGGPLERAFRIIRHETPPDLGHGMTILGSAVL